MVWSRLIRFLDEEGEFRHGEPQIESSEDLSSFVHAGTLTAREIVGDDLFSASPTDKVLRVKKLLGPLVPEDVPIIRCVGLNYATHSTLHSELATSHAHAQCSVLLTRTVKETGRAPPPYPSIFIKPSKSITGWDNDIPIPTIAQHDQLDYEGELVRVKASKTTPRY